MTPTLFNDLRRLGVVFTLHGDRIHVRAPRRVVDPGMKAVLAANKAELIKLLRTQDLGSTPFTTDELELFEERAAIREFNGHMPRDDAERAAREDVRRER